MKYELDPEEKLDVYYTLWSCAQNLADYQKATKAYENLLSLRSEFEKLEGDQGNLLTTLDSYLHTCELMLKFIPN